MKSIAVAVGIAFGVAGGVLATWKAVTPQNSTISPQSASWVIPERPGPDYFWEPIQFTQHGGWIQRPAGWVDSYYNPPSNTW